MAEQMFVGFDGKEYEPKTPSDAAYEVSHDGRFWHISFPIEGEDGGRQVYRGRNLPQAEDRDRWVHYTPYPAWMKRRTTK